MKLVKLLFVVIACLGIASVTYSNHSLDDSQVMSDLSSDIIGLEKDNTVLRAQIAEAGSLSAVNSRVEAMGFVASPKVVTLNVASAIASR